MRIRIVPLLAAVMLAAGIFFMQPPDTAYACSCADDSVEVRYGYSSVVFTGTVSSKDGHGGNTFKVDTVWKGSLPDGYVYSGFFGMCGTEFELGETYLVFTHDVKGVEHTSLCSGNKWISEADADIAVLNRLATPVRSSSAWWPYAVVVAAGAAVYALLLLLHQRNRRADR